MSAVERSPLTGACWGLACTLDVLGLGGCCVPAQEDFLPHPRVQFPGLSLLADGMRLIDWWGVSTTFFLGAGHGVAGLLYLAGFIDNLTEIQMLHRAASLEQNYFLHPHFPAQERLLVPFLSLLSNITMVAFSVLGVGMTLGFAVPSALYFGFGFVSAGAFGGYLYAKGMRKLHNSPGLALLDETPL